VRIGQHDIGYPHPVFVVAEISGNHLGRWGRCVSLAHAAADAGADALKVQCFTPESMTLDIDDDAHRIVWQGRERTLFDLYRETALPLEWHRPLGLLCNTLGMEYFAAEFSRADVDHMQAIGAPCHKCASFELTDIDLVRYMAAQGKPLILSTGMATGAEIDDTLECCEEVPVILLKCVSAYPALPENMNLAGIDVLYTYGKSGYVGLSDHSRSNAVIEAAVAMGACLVERHLTLSRADGGPDAAFSDEPAEFAAMVDCIRHTSTLLGSDRLGPTDDELPMLRYRRSLWVTADVAQGEPFTRQNIASLRPIGGMAPGRLAEVLDIRAPRAYRMGEPLLL